MEGVLSAVADTIYLADRIAGVQVVLADPPDTAARMLGTAGFRDDPEFSARLRASRARGARLATFDGPATLDQRVILGRRDRMLADGAWLPMHAYLRQVEWQHYVATPIPLRRERGGVINCYIASEADVTDRLLDFLRAMARVASVAIESALPDETMASAPRLERLTTREREVLALLGEGLSNRTLALRLGTSERTARTHVSNVLAKLDLQSRTQAALVASRLHW